MKEITVHFGRGKTGTSYLQTYFANVRESLLKYNTYYPPSILIEQDEMIKRGYISSGNLGELLRTMESDSSTCINNILTYIQESFTKSFASRIILSSENVGSTSFKNFCYLKESLESIYKVRWIGLIRDPIGFTISDIFQRTKMGSLFLLNDYFDENLVRFYKKADQKLFILNDYVIDNYLNVKNNLAEWFCDVAGIPFFPLEIKNSSLNIINRSLLPEEAYIKAFINKYFTDIEPNKVKKYSKNLGLYLASKTTELHSNRNIIINELCYLDVKNIVELIANQDYELLTSSLIFATNNINDYIEKHEFSKVNIQDFSDEIETFKPFFIEAINATKIPLNEAILNNLVSDICKQAKQGELIPLILSKKTDS
jgi:hypothetical protein